MTLTADDPRIRSAELLATQASTADAYDAVPYPNVPHRNAHVRTLEAMAALFGMRPTPIAHCRVLELGCATGANLLPQAQEFPESTFVGMDLSRVQIAAANGIAQQANLGNVTFKQASITEIDRSWGQFDYILCHGVFSWVLPEVQNKILAVMRHNLADNGVGLVSYNVYPGWHFRGLVRDAMLYHACRFSDPHEQIAQARAVLDFLHANTPADGSYHHMLGDELKLLKRAPDSYLFHEHLEVENRPLYFHQFAALAEGHGLQYLSETEYHEMAGVGVPKPARAHLSELPVLEREQYLDFLRIRAFRSSLVCHREVPIERRISAAAMRTMSVSLVESPSEVDDKNGELTLRFARREGCLGSRSPAVRRALAMLVEAYPQPTAVAPLLQECAQADVAAATQIGGMLLAAWEHGLIEPTRTPPRFASEAGTQPQATPLARLQATRGEKITNARHEQVMLDVFERHVLALLDGTKDREQIISAIAHLLETKKLVLKFKTPAAHSTATPTLDRATLHALVDAALKKLCDNGLLQ